MAFIREGNNQNDGPIFLDLSLYQYRPTMQIQYTQLQSGVAPGITGVTVNTQIPQQENQKGFYEDIVPPTGLKIFLFLRPVKNDPRPETNLSITKVDQ